MFSINNFSVKAKINNCINIIQLALDIGLLDLRKYLNSFITNSFYKEVVSSVTALVGPSVEFW